MRAKTKLVLRVAAGLTVLTVVGGASACARFKVWVDRRGLSEHSAMIVRDFEADRARPLPPPSSLTPAAQLARARTTAREAWSVDAAQIQEKVTFPSRIRRADGSEDEAVLYVYGQGPLEGADVILWVPGFGVSDFAFHFIEDFFENELAAGYTVVFYNIPFHLERVAPGRAPGEGLVTGNNARNLLLVEQIVDEIGVVLQYLAERDVHSISGWGGSIGGAYLWLASQRYAFDHMTLMIPLVDWTTLIFHEELTLVRERMNAAGVSDEALRNMYGAISPMNVPTKVDPARIQLLYAELDQFTPATTTRAFVDKWGITNVRAYDESHATILTNRRMFRDNRTFIDGMRPRSKRAPTRSTSAPTSAPP